ncbi:hypothetical protein ACH5RR_039337 [Cinchona calisaya]|uniref:Uncharacterized protein n=1 Tax=Cinchona calisaya TaxID=153742 RepID=A0ABD2Y1F2_9GENT
MIIVACAEEVAKSDVIGGTGRESCELDVSPDVSNGEACASIWSGKKATTLVQAIVPPAYSKVETLKYRNSSFSLALIINISICFHWRSLCFCLEWQASNYIVLSYSASCRFKGENSIGIRLLAFHCSSTSRDISIGEACSSIWSGKQATTLFQVI